MRKLDQRGVASFEFVVVAVAFFTLVFAILDLARYAITMQSLRALANAGARSMMISDCYVNAAINKTVPTCSGDPLPSAAAKRAIAPFLYAGGLSPTLGMTMAGSAFTVTASEPGFTMLVPVWGTALNAPSASTQVPF
ncbi:TadE family protein [Bradyrhizobium sp. CCGB01]|uniref:TadE family protein n=1 Tax=Bradyrhizobium sp. CCGB01 TaxID=2949634 RepID=UPI0020B44404|nr:TadE family protein [Bradyrhizobium sp. CCGB01]MCP3410253.1 pilus assembly protein [Bradyrhizobium sp. CCGB01]